LNELERGIDCRRRRTIEPLEFRIGHASVSSASVTLHSDLRDRAKALLVAADAGGKSDTAVTLANA
jgi:hypothetical protein